jgi:drug/metabolite transporter (DMT)-like permease
MLAPMPTSSAATFQSDPVRGAMWMTASCVFFAVLTGMIRYLSATLDPLEIVFFRNLFGLAVMLPWLMRHGLGTLSTDRFWLHALRAGLGLVAMTSWFTAISHLNLADAVALSFTSPLFATIAAVILLGEVVRARRWSAVLIGFAGAMIILRPGFHEIAPESLLVLLSATVMAIGMTLIKILSRTDSTGAIVFYMVLILTPASLVPALFVWRTPTPEEFVWLLLLGGAATLGHLCLTRAFAVADATQVVPFDFIRLPLMALIGYFVFGETLDAWTGIGAAIIVGSSAYIANREAVHRRSVTVPPPRPETDVIPALPRPQESEAQD